MISATLGLLAALAPGWVSTPAAPPALQDETTEAAAPALDVLNNAALGEALTQLAQSANAELTTVATSRGGRAIQALTITGAGEARASARPAILVVAGLDGARAYTSSLAVDHARRLIEGYGSDDAIEQFLDTTTVYVLPRYDVDAAAARFATPLAEVHGTGHGIDNDRDGRQAEDIPTDINADGLITMMRVLDPEGEWIVDPTDARAMKKAERKSGERGLYKLYTEGFDNDGDERYAEDPELDAAVNRNFGRSWSEHADDAGRYPTDEPGALGVVEFVLDHSDIALVIAYGDEGNLVEKPATQKDSGPSKRGALQAGIFEADADVYAELGKRYREVTDNKNKGIGEQPGSLQSFLYHHRGLLTLSIDPWSVPLDAKAEKPEQTDAEEEAADEGAANEKKDEPKPSDEAKRLLWMDQNGVDGFAAWTSFEHPQLGAVEVGGFKPYALVEPQPAALGNLAQSHFEHLLSLGELLPRPTLVIDEVKALGGGLYEVNASLTNEALLPLRTHAASRSRTIAPLQVHLDLPEGATLDAGERRTLINSLAPVGGRRDFQWLITLPAEGDGAALRLVSKNAGQASLALEVK
jgi:Zinc carboxypeptidase